MTTQNRNVAVQVTLGGRVDRSLGAAFDEAQGELSQTEDQIEDLQSLLRRQRAELRAIARSDADARREQNEAIAETVNRLEDARQESRRLNRRLEAVRDTTQEVRQRADRVGDSMRGVLTTVAAIGAATTGAVLLGIRELVQQTHEFQRNIQRANLSLDEGAQIMKEFALAGVRDPVDAIGEVREVAIRTSEALKQVREAEGDYAAATGTEIEVFRELGYTLEDIRRLTQLSADEQFRQVAARIATRDEADRLRLAEDAFGGTLAEVSAAYVNLSDEQRSANAATADSIDVLRMSQRETERLHQGLGELDISSQSARNAIVAAFIPALVSLVDELSPALVGLGDFASENEEVTQTVVGTTAIIGALSGGLLVARGGMALFGLQSIAALGPIALVGVAVAAVITSLIVLALHWDRVSLASRLVAGEIRTHLADAEISVRDFIVETLEGVRTLTDGLGPLSGIIPAGWLDDAIEGSRRWRDAAVADAQSVRDELTGTRREIDELNLLDEIEDNAVRAETSARIDAIRRRESRGDISADEADTQIRTAFREGGVAVFDPSIFERSAKEGSLDRRLSDSDVQQLLAYAGGLSGPDERQLPAGGLSDSDVQQLLAYAGGLSGPDERQLPAGGLSDSDVQQIPAGGLSPSDVRQLLAGGLSPSDVRQLLAGGLSDSDVRQLLAGGLSGPDERQLPAGGLSDSDVRLILAGGLSHSDVQQLLAGGLSGQHIRELLGRTAVSLAGPLFEGGQVSAAGLEAEAARTRYDARVGAQTETPILTQAPSETTVNIDRLDASDPDEVDEVIRAIGDAAGRR